MSVRYDTTSNQLNESKANTPGACKAACSRALAEFFYFAYVPRGKFFINLVSIFITNSFCVKSLNFYV